MLYVRGFQEGGAEKQVERLTYGLGRNRFQIAVGYSDPWGPVGDRLQAAGIPVLQIPARDQAKAECVIRASAPDIFHSFTHQDAVDIAAAAAAGVPAIAASRVNVRWWDERLEVRHWERVRNRMTHRITAVSQAAAALCEEVESVERRNIVVIHNGVAIPDLKCPGANIRDELGLSPKIQLIGYVANYRPAKDHETLLRSFRLVIGRRPGTHLVCCGLASPETRLRLAGLARELGIEPRVSLLESRSAVDTVYRGLDLYVHSSRFEGFSNSLLEAMAHALPVVATDAGGTPEAVVDGVTGMLAPRGQPEALADAVVAMLSDSGRRKQFGQAGRARAERYFSVGTMVEAYARFYAELQEPSYCSPQNTKRVSGWHSATA
jgi:glycosyltransferase involved in cell wall biosynthesis